MMEYSFEEIIYDIKPNEVYKNINLFGETKGLIDSIECTADGDIHITFYNNNAVVRKINVSEELFQKVAQKKPYRMLRVEFTPGGEVTNYLAMPGYYPKVGDIALCLTYDLSSIGYGKVIEVITQYLTEEEVTKSEVVIKP